MIPTILQVAVLVPGRADGEVLALKEPVSFWGGFDPKTGRIIDRRHPDLGACVAGRLVTIHAARGSSSGSSVLAEAIRRGTAPAALILRARDPILTIGAMVAATLYSRPCPVVVASGDEDFARIAASQRAVIEADGREGRLWLVPA